MTFLKVHELGLTLRYKYRIDSDHLTCCFLSKYYEKMECIIVINFVYFDTRAFPYMYANIFLYYCPAILTIYTCSGDKEAVSH